MYFIKDSKKYFLAGRHEGKEKVFVIKKGWKYSGWCVNENRSKLYDSPIESSVRQFDSIDQAQTFINMFLDDSYSVERVGIKEMICPDCNGSKFINGTEKCYCGNGKVTVFEYEEK